MAVHVMHSFCREPRYNPRFKFIEPDASDERMRSLVAKSFDAQRIDVEPAGLRAIRATHPDIRHPGLPDLLTVGSLPVVCEAFRQIVQDLEPDKHQFVPVTLCDEAGGPFSGPYWVMNVFEVRDCLIRADQIRKWDAQGCALPEMEPYWRPRAVPNRNPLKKADPPDMSRPEGRTPSLKVVYVDRSQIQGLHLWRPKRHGYWVDHFLSDELLQRVRRARLRKLSYEHAVEMSVPST